MKTRPSLILTILISMAILLLAACSPAATLAPEDPVSSDDPAAGTPAAPDWQPQPNDDQLTHTDAVVTSTEILTLESYPPQFMVQIEGNKPTPCHQLRAVIGEPDETQATIAIQVYTVVSPDAICAQVIEDFNINLPLGSYASGKYTVTVNGSEIGQIVAP